MAHANLCILLGRVGKDPDFKTFESDKSKVSFTMATTESYKKDGEWQEKTEWHNIVMWNKGARYIGEKARKGDEVYVEGKITTRIYDKDGENRYITEIVANSIQIIRHKGENASSASGSAQNDEIPDNGGDDFPF